MLGGLLGLVGRGLLVGWVSLPHLRLSLAPSTFHLSGLDDGNSGVDAEVS